MNSTDVEGPHYKGTEWQHWDYAMAWLGGRYLESAATKYLTRWRNKDGRRDLLKAISYAEKAWECGTVVGALHLRPIGCALVSYDAEEYLRQALRFCDINHVEGPWRDFFVVLATWRSTDELREAIRAANAAMGAID